MIVIERNIVSRFSGIAELKLIFVFFISYFTDLISHAQNSPSSDSYLFISYGSAIHVIPAAPIPRPDIHRCP